MTTRKRVRIKDVLGKGSVARSLKRCFDLQGVSRTSYPIQNTHLKRLIYYKLSVTEIPCVLIKPFNAYIKTLLLVFNLFSSKVMN